MNDADLKFVGEVPADEKPLLAEVDHEAASSRFDTINEQAIPVVNRAASSYAAKQFTVSADPVPLLGRRRGRRYLALSCPGTVTSGGTGTTPKGFMFSHSRNDLTVGIGFQVNPGDSVTLDAEADVWVAALPGNTTGLVQYIEVFDVLAGPAKGR